MFDKKGNFIEKGQSVEVDEPTTVETYLFGFVGTVNDFQDNHVIVEDMDGDCFSVHPENLEVENPEEH